MGIIDVWRDVHPSEKEFTHFSPPHATYSRINYFLMYKRDRHRIAGTADLFDHSPVYMKIEMGEGRRGNPMETEFKNFNPLNERTAGERNSNVCSRK